MKVHKTDLIVKASILEEGLVEDVKSLITRNSSVFEGEKVVLMVDAHKGQIVPVGFTMTLRNGLLIPELLGSDIGCGVTSYLLRDVQLTSRHLRELERIIRDLIPITSRIYYETNMLTSKGTLGSGNHFFEIGSNGKDLLMSVHSGSRSYGGMKFRDLQFEAREQSKENRRVSKKEIIDTLKAQGRQKEINKVLAEMPKDDYIPYLCLTEEIKTMIDSVVSFASASRRYILEDMMKVLRCMGVSINEYDIIESIHNYVDFSGDVPILRKGSISAPHGTKVVIPLNMRDGIIVGISGITDKVNFSLPHGAGRVMSRTRAKSELTFDDFLEDMEGIYSPTVNVDTLDESPRAYKPAEEILKDIKPYLSSYEIFKTIFNYKGT